MPSRFRHPDLQYIQPLLNRSSLDILKSFIVAARAQCIPLVSSEAPTLYRQTTGVFGPFLDAHSEQSVNLEPSECQYKFSLLANSPFLSGFLINLCQSIPLSPEEVQAVANKSLMAEISVNELERRPQTCNWNAIFDITCVSQPLISSAKPNPALNAHINSRLTAFRREIDGSVLIPHASKKGVSSESVDSYYDLCVEGGATPDVGHICAKSLLSLYLRKGLKTTGRCEVKQKWYPTGLKPRTYYNQGGEAFFASTYLRNFFNTLADIFPYTNRLKRVDISRLELRDDSGFTVYDFSNFTSNFSEQYYFLRELSLFFRGCIVQLVGPDLSLIGADLGDLIDTYAEVVNNSSGYYVGENIIADLDISHDLYQLQAGFLGVYGNLMTCTIPHGIVARQHVEKDTHQSTAGDDGLNIDVDSLSRFLESLWQLGDFAREKCYFSERGVYLKMPLVKGRSGFVDVFRIMFPNLNFNRVDKIQDVRFGHLSSLSSGDLRTRVYRQCITFVRQVMNSGGRKPHDWEAGLLDAIYSDMLVFSRLDEVSSGRSGMLEFGPTHPKLPPLPRVPWQSFRDRNWKSYPDYNEHSFARRFRIRGRAPFDDEDILTVGSTIRRNAGGICKLLELGEWIRKVDDVADETMFEVVSDEYVDDFMNEGPEVYTYEVMDTIDPVVIENFREYKSELKRVRPDELTSYVDQEPVLKRRKLEISFGRYIPDWDDPRQYGEQVDTLFYEEGEPDVMEDVEDEVVSDEEVDFPEYGVTGMDDGVYDIM